MENAKEFKANVGRPITREPNTKYGFLKVHISIHDTIRNIAVSEERNIQTVTERILKKALQQEGFKEFISNK
ncbi:MAG: hypothetical protein KKF62_14115 [Bacteroidetes bacterium]|nr:hypothetical protein [Bacteroidota bacterium]MBU1114197.1 hypothetical protein [Bacteroidota bacterium]MBU1797007.1 hypothetical protein [Bacteroidota bacterium]